MSAITRILPRKKLSQWIGKIVHWRGPKWWAYNSIQAFAWWYDINLSEAEKEIFEYASIGDFFTRKLKQGIRPIENGFQCLHPADSRLTQWGSLSEGQLIQAKGKLYSALSFVSDENLYKQIKGGQFFTYYLCPTDYHRVHSPIDGKIIQSIHIPGDLWPVNEWSTQNIDEVFNQNERVVLEIQTEWGPVALVFVGATNVGSIKLSFDSSIIGNDGSTVVKSVKYSNPIEIKKGDELGLFAMGSTVVMLYPPTFVEKFKGQFQGLGEQVRVNKGLC